MIESWKIKLYDWSEFYGKKIGLDLSYFIKNGFWMTLRQIADIIIGTALFAVFARLVAKEAFGYYQFVMAVFAVVSITSIPGLNTSVLREVARGYDGEYASAVKKSFFWSLTGVPVIALVGFYYYMFDNRELGTILMVTSIFFPFFYAPNTWSAFLQGKCEYKKFTIFGIVQSLANAIATIAVIYFNNNALLVISAYLFSYSIFNIIYYYKSLSYIENNKNSGEAMKYGWFLTKINFFNFAAENVDKIIIGTLMSPVSLAIFSIVSALPFKLKMFVKSIFSITFPKMSQDNFRAVDFIKRKQGRIILIFASIFSIIFGVAYFSLVIPVSKFFFGDNYSDYYYYGKYFAILVVTHTPLLIANWYLQAKKMSKSIAYINIVSFFIKIISLIIGVKMWGIVGGIWMYNLNTVLLLVMHIVAIYIEDAKHTKSATA